MTPPIPLESVAAFTAVAAIAAIAALTPVASGLMAALTLARGSWGRRLAPCRTSAVVARSRRFDAVGVTLDCGFAALRPALVAHSVVLGFSRRVVSRHGRSRRVCGSRLAIWVVVLIVHSGAMRPTAAATLASARTALVHTSELKKEILAAYETRVSRVRARRK
jgi:hypothetical protein